jgi:hypothetical protein
MLNERLVRSKLRLEAHSVSLVQTEFQERSLVTSAHPLEVVRVKETTSTGCQTIVVEGSLSDDFFKIRDAVYSMYSAV